MELEFELLQLTEFEEKEDFDDEHDVEILLQDKDEQHEWRIDRDDDVE